MWFQFRLSIFDQMCFGEKNYDFKHHRYLPFPWTIGNSQGVWDEFIEPNHHFMWWKQLPHSTSSPNKMWLFLGFFQGDSELGPSPLKEETFLSFENEGRKGDTVIVFLWRAAVGRLRGEQATVRHSQEFLARSKLECGFWRGECEVASDRVP